LATNQQDHDMLVAPDLEDSTLTRAVQGYDADGILQTIRVIEERPLTIFLNGQEIITAMTIGDYPDYLALGFLRNQRMLRDQDTVLGVDYDPELGVVVVRTDTTTNFEQKMAKKTRTSGCAVGTVFGDVMDGFDDIVLPDAPIKTSWLYTLSAKINRTPSLYLEAGAVHATVLCQGDQPLVYMEDVGRHNAVDKIAGYMLAKNISPADKILYTTGRLTSEMIIKTAMMGIPTLVSRSGFTAWGVELANTVGLTVIGRLKGKRFICLSGENRLIRDAQNAEMRDD